MHTQTDTILAEMADEMRKVLIAAGIDHTSVPVTNVPFPQSAVDEYLRRGGEGFTDAQVFGQALTEEIARA